MPQSVGSRPQRTQAQNHAPRGGRESTSQDAPEARVTSNSLARNRIDGPKFVAWLERRDIFPRDPSDDRSLRRAAMGDSLMVASVDRILVGLGRNLSELPDHFFIAVNRPGTYPREVHDRALTLYRAGMPPKAIVETLAGPSVDCINKWVRGAGLDFQRPDLRKPA